MDSQADTSEIRVETGPIQDSTSLETSAAQAQTPSQEIDIRVTISADGMQAFLDLHSFPAEPYPFTMDIIEQAFSKYNLVDGILSEDITRVLEKKEYVAGLLVARGIPPVAGEDARIEFLFDPEPKPFAAETDQKVDWREINLIQQVKENQPVARKVPMKLGVPGVTVLGKRVEAARAREVQMPMGRGTKINPNDPNELVAATAGSLRLEGTRVVIDPVLTIPHDVDYSIGNIDFQGSVHVKGNVLPGFRVKATGNIKIEGYVEGASIESGESISIYQGAIGKINDTTIKAGKDVVMKFARGVSVVAGGDISIQTEAILCQLQSGGVISVGVPDRRLGRIVGSQLNAKVAVHAVNLGTEKETATVVMVAQKSASPADQAPETKAERTARLRQGHTAIMAEIAKLLNKKAMNAANWTADEELRLSRYVETANKVEEELYMIDEEPDEEEVEAERPKEKPRVVVHGTLFPGVRVTIGHAARSITQQMEHVQLVLTDDKSSVVSLGLDHRQ